MDTRWDLTKIYKTREDFTRDIEEARKELEDLKELKGNFTGNFKGLVELMVINSERISKISVYANMTRDEDSTQTLGQELVLEADKLYNDYISAWSFLKPALLELSEDELDKLIQENDLHLYDRYLKEIFRYKDHTLTKDQEYVMGAMGQMAATPASAFYMLTNADMTFPPIEAKGGAELTNANYTNFLRDNDVGVRKEAFTKFYSTFQGVENTLASLYADNVRSLVTEAELRGYDSALQMELYQDDVDVKVYENLIATVRANLPSIHEYYRLKKDALGLESQHMYDVYLDIGGDLETKISYGEARDLIIKAAEPMGEAYVEVLKRAFDERWIDVYPRKGKRSGAYSSGVYSSDPYILMNYTDDLNSLFTLAHELGHSMHSYLSRKNNPYVYSSYTIFAAEVASTTNELLLLNYLLDRAEDKKERIYLINHYLDSFKSTVFRQTMFAEFEKKTHEAVENGQVLTLDKFNQTYYQLNEDYFGDGVFVDKEIQLEWARIPHFYRNFYVYKYATGFLSAVILSKNILEGRGLDAYLNFLADGSNHYPIDQLKGAGVDVMDPKSFDSAFQVFKGLVEELRELLD